MVFSIVLNGNQEGQFRGKKGLRQGDPLSPSLFVIIMDYFSCALIKLFQLKKIDYHPFFYITGYPSKG